METYRVATFFVRERDGELKRRKITAYTRVYNEQWPGCEIHDIEAESGTEAKRKAIEVRYLMEKLREQGSPR